jgi:multiple sugar transport system ATP-binding protein
MADLRLQSVSKTFGDVRAVQGLDLDIRSGEFIVLLGPSGAGKTTTLRLVAGLETPEAGHIYIGGRDVTALAPALRDVTFVFQQYSLYPHLSVFDNLAFPLRSPLHATSELEIKRKVTEVARMLRIEDKLQNPATKLSGGQMQRVAIGRALVRNPAVYLMDEPLSSLDAKLRSEMRIELKRIQQDLGATLLYVTQDQTEALTMATRIGVLEKGRLVQLGTPREIYENPISSYVASRLGSPRINLIPKQALGDIGASTAPTAAVTLGVRAEHVLIKGSAAASDTSPAATGSASCAARVLRSERLSDQHLVHLMLQAADSTEHSLVAAVAAHTELTPGDAVQLQVQQPLWFGADGQRIAA